jgi:hypothetical protein
MRRLILPIAVVAAASFAAITAASADDLKQVPYPEVKVKIPEQYKPDAAFAMLQKSLSDAVAGKNGQALFVLVGPTFVWLQDDEIADEFDLGGDALQNFKVVFGFRKAGTQADGGVKDGPYWDDLANFAANTKLQKVSDNLVCGPMNAIVSDQDTLDGAREKIGAGDSTQWYFTLGDTEVTDKPGGGAVIGKVGQVALPLLDEYPQAREGSSETPAVTHRKVLLPSGKSGWIPVSAALLLFPDRLCYAAAASGDWKIVEFNQSE